MCGRSGAWRRARTCGSGSDHDAERGRPAPVLPLQRGARMPIRTGGAHCCNCGRDVMTHQNVPNHVLHLLLTIVTGVWLLVWIWLVVFGTADVRCTVCGHRI